MGDVLGDLDGLLGTTIRNSTPLAFAALGGMFSARSGVVNVGLEGLMLIGAFAGAVGAYYSGVAVVGLAAALLAGLAFALLHAFVTVTLDADQIISGVGINLLALGGTGFLMVVVFDSGATTPTVAGLDTIAVPVLAELPVVGQALFDQSALVYLLYLLVPLCWFVLARTSFGLRLRATGEGPEAAHTAGLSVPRLRYVGVGLSGVLAAFGGAYLSLSLLSAFTENMTLGRGFIALAALILGRWSPIGAVSAALLLGFAQAVVMRGLRAPVPPEFQQMLPYLLTLAALAGFGGRAVAHAIASRPYRKE